MILRSPTKHIIVMPAWIAGVHQARKDASRNIQVSLDASTPCWHDAIEGALLKLTEALSFVFSKEDSKSTTHLNFSAVISLGSLFRLGTREAITCGNTTV